MVDEGFVFFFHYSCSFLPIGVSGSPIITKRIIPTPTPEIKAPPVVSPERKRRRPMIAPRAREMNAAIRVGFIVTGISRF